MSYRGRLFVFEGMDSVGKTTLSQALAKSLNDQGEPADWFAFPGRKDNSLGALVLWHPHHNPVAYKLAAITPLANQVLHIAAHLDAIENVILPSLNGGRTVVLDRFWWSTIIYGPRDARSSSALLKFIEAEKDIWSGITPTALFLIKRERPLDIKLWNSRWDEMQQDYISLASNNSSNFPVCLFENRQTISESLSHIVSRIDGLSQST